jgi:hypothetical protein
MTGNYWNKLAHCEKLFFVVVTQYSCENHAAYRSVSAFAIMMFIVQTACAILTYLWRAELIDESGRYDEISNDSSHGNYGQSQMPTFNPFSKPGSGSHPYGQIQERSAEL